MYYFTIYYNDGSSNVTLKQEVEHSGSVTLESLILESLKPEKKE